MNTNTNTSNTAPASAGSKFGNRVKGVAEVVHGAGENLRGSILGAVDTMGHKGMTQNDEIAHQGRLEMERGMSNMKGVPGPTTQSSLGSGKTSGNYATTGANATHGGGIGSGTTDLGTSTNNPISHGGPNVGAHNVAGANTANAQTVTGHGGVGDQHASTGAAYGPDSTYPAHHRDDAITGVPQNQLNDVQAINHQQQIPGQGVATGAGSGGHQPQTYNANPPAVNPSDPQASQKIGTGPGVVDSGNYTGRPMN